MKRKVSWNCLVFISGFGIWGLSPESWASSREQNSRVSLFEWKSLGLKMVCRDPRFLWTDLNEQPESITLKWWKSSCQKSMDLDVRTSIFLFCKNMVFQSPPLPWTAKFSLYKKAGIRKWRKCGWPRFWKPKNSKVQVFCFCDLCFQPLSKPGKINGYAPKHSHIQEKKKSDDAWLKSRMHPGSPRPNKEWSLGWFIWRIPYYQWAKFGLWTP